MPQKSKKVKKIEKKESSNLEKRMTWFDALQSVKPYVFKISTPRGSGTGFQITYASNSNLCGIATAYHVIDHEHKWELPIEVKHFETGETLLLKESDRVIFAHPKEDLAFILFSAKKLSIKKDSPKLITPKTSLKAGVEVGWCGFPSVSINNLCFFSGYISCSLDNAYLVDGVAINGVSGGPVFWTTLHTNEVIICGLVSAYIPNTATGTTLPVLSVLTSVEPYLKDLENLKNFDDAKKEAERKEETSTSSIPTPSSE